MGKETGIEWTDATWNPIRGCSRVSEGCRHCYAEKIAARFSGPGMAYEGLAEMRVIGEGTDKERTEAHWTGKIGLVEKHLSDPLYWKKPQRIFVNSMSDLFHENVPDEWIDRIFAVMALTPEHTYQILTKRPDRMRQYMKTLQYREVPVSLAITRTPWWDSPQGSPCAVGTIEDRIGEGPLPNVWMGVSVEDQKAANDRIPTLMLTPAAVRWISAEPLLGPVNLEDLRFDDGDGPIALNALSGVAEVLESTSMDIISDDPENPRLAWVVAGGESGNEARPMHPDWVRSLRDQCQKHGTSFFFKQWGEYEPVYAGMEGWKLHLRADGQPAMVRSGKKAAGHELEGREWQEFPDVEVRSAATRCGSTQG